jgi:hypothetical protein
MEESDCVERLSAWIIEFKRRTYATYVKSENDSNELTHYRNALETLETQIRKAIYLEDFKSLETLEWPSELMECVKNMAIRTELLDLLYESLHIHPFNRSPLHEKELREANAGLM